MTMLNVTIAAFAIHIFFNAATNLWLSAGLTSRSAVAAATCYPSAAKDRERADEERRIKDQERTKRTDKNQILLFHYTKDEAVAQQICVDGALIVGTSDRFGLGAYATTLAAWLSEEALTRSDLVKIVFGDMADYVWTTYYVAFLEVPTHKFVAAIPGAIYVYRAPRYTRVPIIPLVYGKTLLGERER